MGMFWIFHCIENVNENKTHTVSSVILLLLFMNKIKLVSCIPYCINF